MTAIAPVDRVRNTRAPQSFSAAAVIEAARRRRAEVHRTGQRRALLVSSGVVVLWTLLVTVGDQWGRVGDNAAAALTMVFGSFVAGSTPQGGGAVAFPVFTKILGVSAPDAATFSLSIQAIGMGSTAAIIALTGRAVDRGSLRLTVPSAIVGFLVGTALFSLVSLPGTYTKLFFTLVVVAAGASTVLSRRRGVVEQLRSAPLADTRTRIAVILVAALGGIASALFGSGADVAVYLLLTIVLGVRPSIGVATSVVTMAAVSIVGLGLSFATGAITPAPIADTDIFGMWLAAIPVVVIGAPLGSLFASRVSPGVLAGFIAALAGLELASTALFLEELRTDPVVTAFGVAALVATFAGVRTLLALRDRVARDRDPQALSIRRIDFEIGANR